MRSRWATLALVTLAHTLGAFSIIAVVPLSPFLFDALELSRVQVGLFLPAIYLGGVLTALPAGWLTDRLGVRVMLSVGQAVTGIMVGLAALSPGLAALLGFLFIGGFGWSVLNPTTGRAIVDAFPLRERGLAMGVKQTGLTLGGLSAALVLPPLALATDWRHALGVAGGASLLSAILVGLAYRLPSSQGTVPPAHKPRLTELKPFLRRPGLLVVFGCGLALSMTQYAFAAYLVLYARESYRMTAVEAARLLALAQAGGTAGRIAWGVVSDRLFGGRRRPGIIVAALIGATAYVIFALADGMRPVPAALLAVIAGAGAYGWVGLYFALVAEVGGTRYAGLLTGVALTFAWAGVLMGPPIFGLILEAGNSYRHPWLTLAAVELLVSVALSRPQPLVQRR